MKYKYLIPVVLIFFTVLSYGQLVNNGATIFMKNGSVLNLSGDMINQDVNSEIIMEAGSTLKLSGDLTNAGTITADPASTLEFTGDEDSNWQSNGSDFGNVVLNKTTANVNVLLADPAVILTDLSFNADANLLDINSYDLTLESGATISSTDDNEYIQADGTGKLIRFISSAGSYDFPVGDVDDYSPLNMNVSGTPGVNAELSVRVVASAHPNLYTEADAYLERYWKTEANDISSYSATLTGTYAAGDVVGTESLIKGASYVADWSFAGAAGGAGTVTGDVTGSAEFTGKNFFGRLASVKVFLEGPYSGSQMMTSSLTSLPLGSNDGDHFPNVSPYGTGETITSIPTDATDWIKLEVRDAGDPSTVLNSYGKFIKKDGQIIESDGSTGLLLKDAPTSGYLAVKHRNHLGIRTTSALDLVTASSHDFTTGSGQAYGTDPMKEVSTGVWGMWGGNANGDDRIKYNGSANDKVTMLLKVGFTTPNNIVTGYFNEDVNLNSNVKYNGSSNDKVFMLLNVGFTTPNNIIYEQL